MLAWSRDDQPLRHMPPATQQQQMPPPPSLQRYHVTSELAEALPPPTRMAAMRQLLRSSGAGASEAFLPRLAHDHDGAGHRNNHPVWTNENITDRDTVATVELKPLSAAQGNFSVDPSNTSLEITVIAEDAHKSFPTACIISVSTNHMIRSAEDDLTARDIVIKEWRLLSPPTPTATLEQRTSISMRTISNIASVLHEGPGEGDLTSSNRRIFLTLRFVGCCDLSNRHSIRQVHLVYVSSGNNSNTNGGSVSQPHSIQTHNSSMGPRHSSSADSSAAQRRALTSVMENVILSPMDGGASGKRRGEQHHAVSGLNDSVDLEIRMDLSPPPPPPAPHSGSHVHTNRAAYGIGDTSTASSTDGAADRRSISPREPSHFRYPTAFEEDAAVASHRMPRQVVNHDVAMDVGDRHRSEQDAESRSNSDSVMGVRTPTQNQRQRARVRGAEPPVQVTEPNVVEIFASPCGAPKEPAHTRISHNDHRYDPDVMVLAISPIVGGGGGKGACRIQGQSDGDCAANTNTRGDTFTDNSSRRESRERSDVVPHYHHHREQRDDEPVEMSVHEVELPPHVDFAEEGEDDIVLYSLSPAPAAPSSAPLHALHHRSGTSAQRIAKAPPPAIQDGDHRRNVVSVPSLDVSETEGTTVVRRSISMSDEDESDNDREAMMPPTRGPPPAPSQSTAPTHDDDDVLQQSWQRVQHHHTTDAVDDGVPPRSKFTSVAQLATAPTSRTETIATLPVASDAASTINTLANMSKVRPSAAAPPSRSIVDAAGCADDVGMRWLQGAQCDVSDIAGTRCRAWAATSGAAAAPPPSSSSISMRCTANPMHLPSKASFVAVKGIRAAAEWRGDTSDDSVEYPSFPRRPAPVMTEESLQNARRSVSSLEQVPAFTASDDLFARIGDVLGVEPQSISRPSSRRNSRASSVDSRSAAQPTPTERPPLASGAAATTAAMQLTDDAATVSRWDGMDVGSTAAAPNRFGVGPWRPSNAAHYDAVVDAIATTSAAAGRFSIYDEDLPPLSALPHRSLVHAEMDDPTVASRTAPLASAPTRPRAGWHAVDTAAAVGAAAGTAETKSVGTARRSGTEVAIPTQERMRQVGGLIGGAAAVAPLGNRMMQTREALPVSSNAPVDLDAAHRGNPAAALTVQQVRWSTVATTGGSRQHQQHQQHQQFRDTEKSSASEGAPSDVAPLVDVVLWCNKHHTSRNGTGRRCVVLRPTVDGAGVSFTMKKPDGSSWKGPAVPITSPQPLLESEGLAGNNLHTNLVAASSLSNTIVLEKSSGIQVVVGDAACRSSSIHQNRVRCAAHCVVVLRKGRLVTSMELDNAHDVQRFVDALQPVL